jgi:hypothetical protein
MCALEVNIVGGANGERLLTHLAAVRRLESGLGPTGSQCYLSVRATREASPEVFRPRLQNSGAGVSSHCYPVALHVATVFKAIANFYCN